jgi:large subunit ribosomal protein L29
MNSAGAGVTVRGPSGDVEKGRSALKASELHEKTPDQLKDQLTALKKEAFNLRFQKATGQMENTSRMRAVRRDAARVLTVLNQKAANAAKGA